MKPELLYSEICQGYSEIEWNGRCFIKHLTPVEQNSLQKYYDEAYQRALSLGAKTEKEVTHDLIRDGKWSAAQEIAIENHEKDIERLELSKSKIKSLQQIDSIYDLLQYSRGKRIELLTEKSNLISSTAEIYADKELRSRQMIVSCFRDVEFKSRIFEDSSFDYINEISFATLSNSFFSKIYDINADSLKELCVSKFFYNLFSLAEKSFDFFQIPVFKLTGFQVNLLKYAETFSKIATEISDFKGYDENADKMLMYWYYVKNGGEEEDSKKEQNVSKFRSQIRNGVPDA